MLIEETIKVTHNTGPTKPTGKRGHEDVAPANILQARNLFDVHQKIGELLSVWDLILIEAKKVYSGRGQAADALLNHIYQAAGQCVAAAHILEKQREETQEPSSGQVIKFTLTTGEAWLFGLVDCRASPRVCYFTEVHVDMEHKAVTIKRILRMLIYWLGSSGQDLLSAFPYFRTHQ
ncbi:hypothetical protein P691DRAFT_807312 [Macrolepiota fuliginosa MF-IS2]|uniref:Uncharacterized protein n=1 Tax=Macrolepiota fuliginosa MF-IS2 TaxID=1400762 RepID=A0A9P5X250_9AGAR|nr:hypothetical protein P691DRAFT_810340 [Macrolepiota fuliginosa MF-IS2]KAF9444468.1 hypothetical protein P691DRAFT_807312 [Macrolepiota fuliginosa MF-IS2]